MKTAVIALALALAACGGSQPPPPAPPPASAAEHPPRASDAEASRRRGRGLDETAASLATMSRFTDAMCKCADRDCTERVTAEITRWAQDMVKAGGHEVTMSDEDTRQMAEITERLTTCVTGVMTSGAGSGASP